MLHYVRQPPPLSICRLVLGRWCTVGLRAALCRQMFLFESRSKPKTLNNELKGSRAEGENCKVSGFITVSNLKWNMIPI